jgi:ubiquinol-cytochrome c reductase cytochrome b subunit
VIFFLAVFVGPPEIGKPPDPTIIQASPRPDWYFLWYFALLSLIPNWSEAFVIVVVPLAFILFLIALPLVAAQGERSPIRRPWSIVLVIFLVGTIGYYWHEGMRAPWSPRMDAPPLPESVVGVSSGPIADGARVFYDKGCEYCHVISGYGGIRGPDLSDAGDRMTRAEMITRIYSGAANMPSYANNVTPEQLNVLLAFLQSRHRAYKYKISSPAIAESRQAR